MTFNCLTFLLRMLSEPSHVLRDQKAGHMENLPHDSSSTDSPGVVPVTAEHQSTNMELNIIHVLLFFNP